jgi:colanic acid/amylovoran biosynthesis protein
MNIVVESGSYILLNSGDNAMLQVTGSRLNRLFQKPVVQIFTDYPERLAFYCPEGVPLPTGGRQTWSRDGYLFGMLYYLFPKNPLNEPLREVEREIRRRWPALAELLIRFKLKRIRVNSQELNDYLKVVSTADLVVVSGMGGITDAFEDHALGILNTLGLAIHRGIPTVMFGQGIGPIQQPHLRAQAKAVLPKVNLICLRETRASGPLLHSLGVSPDRILATGDDAVELAYQARPDQLGYGLGVNLRSANYSQVDQDLIRKIGVVLQDAAQRYSVPMIPVPISRVPGEEDAATIQQLVGGYQNGSYSSEELDMPLKVIKQVSHCRLVVTGSYHGAVFALAQGIPVIGLAKSDYYVDKFMGLAEHFTKGYEVVSLKDPQLSAKLGNLIEKMWQSAGQFRPKLLDAAERQVGLSWAAYRRVCELIRSSEIKV